MASLALDLRYKRNPSNCREIDQYKITYTMMPSKDNTKKKS